MEPSVPTLVVEDEQAIRDMVEDALVEAGFAVVQAATGDDALGLLDADGAAYRALVTDVKLGRGPLTGWDVAKRAREINDQIPVVYMTGDSAHDWASKGVPNSILIHKPFVPAQIVTAVSQLLNGSAPPTI